MPGEPSGSQRSGRFHRRASSSALESVGKIVAGRQSCSMSCAVKRHPLSRIEATSAFTHTGRSMRSDGSAWSERARPWPFAEPASAFEHKCEIGQAVLRRILASGYCVAWESKTAPTPECRHMVRRSVGESAGASDSKPRAPGIQPIALRNRWRKSDSAVREHMLDGAAIALRGRPRRTLLVAGLDHQVRFQGVCHGALIQIAACVPFS